MKSVNVNVNPPYTVLIGSDVRRNLTEWLLANGANGKLHIVTDDRVAPLYLEETLNALKDAACSVSYTVLPAGENAKTKESLFEILSNLSKNGFMKNDILVALGGGSVSDVTGLSASLYMRGIRYITLPTTLLSMVDAAVGGKCAIDFAGVKNLLGAFYQPSYVLMDLDTLKTLDAAEYRQGMAEIIKYAMINKDFAKFYMQNADLETLIYQSVRLKSQIVSQDEKDGGIRKILNFGHTFAHAVEAASGYKISHGESVAIGMALVTRAAVKRGYCDPAVLTQLQSELKKHRLPDASPLGADELYPLVLKDKKASGNDISLIVPLGFGEVKIEKVAISEIYSWLTDGIL